MIKNLLGDDEPEPQSQPRSSRESRPSSSVQTLFDSTDDGLEDTEDFVIRNSTPDSTAETFRRTGLAWSAGAAFGGAVIFMLVLGWGADVLLGTSPWGIVGGIIIGSAIGFIQFFRITSQIFKK